VSQPNASTLLKQGIAAAKAGDKPLAQQYLLQVIEIAPEDESPWLWLAITAGSQAEQIGYLQQALAVNPNNKRTAAALQKLEGRTLSVKAKRLSDAQPTKTAVSSPPPVTKPVPPLPPVSPVVVKRPAVKPVAAKQPVSKPPTAKPVAVKQPKPTPSPPKLTWNCPLCESPSPEAQTTCPTCRAILAPEQGMAALKNGEADRSLLQEAVHRLKNVPSKNSERADELYWMGIAYLNLGQAETAVSHINAALRLRPEEKAWTQLLNQLNTQPQAAPKKAPPPTKVKLGNVMIVDDSPTICKLVGMTLERKGYEVAVAVDGMDALAKLNENVPDLILLDITMPRMDGYQLCKIVKGNDETKHVPVVMLSGKDGFFDKVRGRMAGSTDYITKPFEPQFLAQTVKKHINKS